MPRAKKLAALICTVVNVKDSSIDDYDIYIGRPGILGNLYKIGPDGNRETVIKKFQVLWYSDAYKGRRNYAIRHCTGKRLGCHCKPEDCHGDIIAEFVNNHAKEQTRHT